MQVKVRTTMNPRRAVRVISFRTISMMTEGGLSSVGPFLCKKKKQIYVEDI